MKGKTILLISPEPWGENFVSKHHYANYLSKENTVYFLNPAHGFSKNPFGNIQLKQKNIKPNLHVLDYLNLLPRINSLPKFTQVAIYKKQAQQIINFIPEKINLVWSFDPYRYFDQKCWGNAQTIYHTVDFHPNAKYEVTLLKSSDYFLGVTPLILDPFKTIRKGIVIPHAADLDGFEHEQPIELPGNNTIRACYVGNFHRHIDYPILTQMAQENPTVDFILIGPLGSSNLSSKNTIKKEQFETLQALKNIHFIGPVQPKLLMSYIKQCHVNLVLFKKGQEITHCSPHKLMGYFYSGNVTLTNYIDAHKNTDPDIIKMIRQQENIPAAFSKIITHLAIHNAPELKTKRIEFAKANGYSEKIKEINAIIGN